LLPDYTRVDYGESFFIFLFAVPFNLFAQEYDHWEAGIDLLWLINKKWILPVRNWSLLVNQFINIFGERCKI